MDFSSALSQLGDEAAKYRLQFAKCSILVEMLDQLRIDWRKRPNNNKVVAFDMYELLSWPLFSPPYAFANQVEWHGVGMDMGKLLLNRP